jgi:hypothetical protein
MRPKSQKEKEKRAWGAFSNNISKRTEIIDVTIINLIFINLMSARVQEAIEKVVGKLVRMEIADGRTYLGKLINPRLKPSSPLLPLF